MTVVTAVLTFYNSIEFVDAALEQVRAQTFQDFELIVVDDGSTDGTDSALERALSEMSNARFIRNDTNVGIAESRNRAVAQSTGEFIWFIDCDDRWSPNILRSLHGRAASTDADMVICGAVRVTDRDLESGKSLDGGIDGEFSDAEAINLLLLGRIRGYLWNKLIRRRFLLEHPFPRLSSQSDFAAVSAIVFAGARIAFVPQTLYWHVERMGSITNSRIDSFSNLATSLESVERAVASRPDAPRFDEELAYFRQWFYRSSIVNTTIRLGVTDPRLTESARELRRGASVREIARMRRFSRREAAIAAAMKLAGPLYPAVYRSYLRKVRA